MYKKYIICYYGSYSNHILFNNLKRKHEIDKYKYKYKSKY